MQVIGYETAVQDTGPALVLGDGGQVDRVRLTPGTELTFGLGTRHCAGVLEGDRHEYCGNDEAPYCRQHTEYWPCAVCRGNCAKPLPNCDRPHVVYLAAFAPAVFKVGVTKPTRLFDRFREQGADRAAVIESHPDGRAARQREAAIASTVGDRVAVAQKRLGMHRQVDDDAWQRLLGEFDPAATYSFDYGIDLERAPVEETTAYGVVRGTKGRLLVLTAADTTYGVDLRALVGYELTAEATGSRQSSLDAY